MKPLVQREVIAPNTLPTPFGVWSPAVLSGPGRLLFLSGLTARRPDGTVIGEGDISAQTEQVCENMGAACLAAGGSLADIASVTVYVCDIASFASVHAVRARYFPTDPPASAMVEVSRLVDPRCLIEISAIAVLPNQLQESS